MPEFKVAPLKEDDKRKTLSVHCFWFAHPRKSLAGEMDVLPDVAEILNSLFLSCQPVVRPPNTFLPVVGLAIRMVGNHVFAFISF